MEATAILRYSIHMIHKPYPNYLTDMLMKTNVYPVISKATFDASGRYDDLRKMMESRN